MTKQRNPSQLPRKASGRSRGLEESHTPSQPNSSTPPPNRNSNNTEIHWEPPSSFKRQDPATPSPATNADLVAPSGKTRRLLPPSRRVDDGDDMVDMDSPPKLVRKNRNKSNPIVPPSPMELIGKENSKQEMSNPNRSEHTNYRVPVSQTFHKRASNKGKDLAELLPTTSSPEASTLFYPRMDSVRSMNSRSVASHSTQAELDFYSQRKEYSSTVAAGVMAPPLWVASSSSKDNESAGANNSVAGTVHQRRRGMLAKSARMLRSHRPTWDRSESAHSFASQSSSAAWSLGGSTLGGISRASSRKSLHSWNTSSQPSRTSISPPDQARNTSSSTVGRPRRIVDDTGVTMHAHRPVPGQGGISRQAATPAPTTTSYYPNVGDIYRYGRATERSLLEDDDDYNVMGNLLTTMSVMGGVGELDEDAESPSDEDEEDGDTVAALGGMWEPHPGSFVPYQRES